MSASSMSASTTGGSAISARPGYRGPWQHGAKGYPEADSIEALRDGAKRKRNTFIVHLNHDGFGDLPCASCGIALRDIYAANPGGPLAKQDKWGTGTYFPKRKRLVVQHYYCSWQTLMSQVLRLGAWIDI